MEFLQFQKPVPAPATNTPQLRRSCEACRASKSRCYPSIEDPAQCQKCIIHGQECIFMETKARAKKTKKPFPTRVEKVEHRLHEIDGILAMLSRGHWSEQSSVASPSDIGKLAVTYSSTSPEDSALQSNKNPLSSISSLPVHSLPGHVGINDAIGRGVISFDQGQQCLDLFRSRVSGFPFIVIDQQITLDIIRRDNPFLLLSILAMATEMDSRLQDTLEAELRETFSRRAIVNGETSLDLLQGLLLYLTWYHFFLRPGHQQIYRLSQISISMAVDLGITKPHRKTKCMHPYIDEGDFLNHKDLPLRVPSTSKSLVLKRTFLGCYYQSSCLSTALRKPLGLRYTDYLGQCAQELSSTKLYDTDVLIPYFIKIQRLSDDANFAFDYDDNQQLPELDTIRIESHRESFSRRLNEIEQKIPHELWSNVTLTMSLKHLRIYINEIALHSIPPTFDTLYGDVSCLSWHSSVARTESLALGVESAKLFLDNYLSLSTNALRSFSFLEHLRSFYALLIVLIFAAGVDSPTTGSLQTSANVEFYITGVIDRATALISPKQDEEQADFFWQLTNMLKITHTWFRNQSKQSITIQQGSGRSDGGSAEMMSGLSGTGNWNEDILPDDWQFDLDTQFDDNVFLNSIMR